MTLSDWYFELICKEQREEQHQARRALELFEVIGAEGTGCPEVKIHVGRIAYNGED